MTSAQVSDALDLWRFVPDHDLKRADLHDVV